MHAAGIAPFYFALNVRPGSGSAPLVF
jgi:hypothetical protein